MKNFINTYQQKIVLTIGYLLVAFLSFQIGLASDGPEKPPEIRVEEAFAPINNSLKSGENQPNPTPNPGSLTPTGQIPVGECPIGQIKGNIGAKEKVYHLPGTSFYNRTKAEKCFKTEEEAVAAGFRKSK